MSRLLGEGLSLGYGGMRVSDDLDIAIPDGSFTVIVGPNGCGKSTLLRALARLLTPDGGSVHLDGATIGSYPAKEVARRLGLLPQGQVVPDGISVVDLVSRGRFPHQGWLRQWSADDERAVQSALSLTGTSDLAGRLVDELSGGQRQRVWLAMALAQETSILLLDEPTTYLDISHQVEVLDLCLSLRAARGHTMVAVLHDLNLACRYATHLVAMKDGRVVVEGPPGEIVTADMVEAVFGLGCRIISDPETGTPLVVPRRSSLLAPPPAAVPAAPLRGENP